MTRTILLTTFLVISMPVVLADGGERIIETYGYEAKEKATGLARGKQVYEQWCIICHDSGPGMAGTEALMRKYRGEIPALLTDREGLTSGFIATLVRNGVKSMPTFRKTEISDEDLELLGRYLEEPRAVHP